MAADLMRTPGFDVVMPLYNKRAYVEDAIRSVLAQAELHALIVVDDGSTDGSADKVEALARDDARIRLLRQSNAGVSAARNRGVYASSADYVAFLDADDLYLPGFLQQIAALAGRYPEAALLGTAYRRFSGEADTALNTPAPGLAPEPGRLVPAFFEEWSRGSFIFTSSICVLRQALLDLGTLFPEGERLGEDQDVWFRLAERYPVAVSARALALYRVDATGSLTASTPHADLLPCFIRLGQRIDRGELPARHEKGAQRLLASHYMNVARLRAGQGDFSGARQLLADPRARLNALYWLRTLVWSAWRQMRSTNRIAT